MFEHIFSAIPADAPRPLTLVPGLAYANAYGFGRSYYLVATLLVFVPAMLAVLAFTGPSEFQLRRTDVAAAKVISVEVAPQYDQPTRHFLYEFVAANNVRYRGTENICDTSPYYSVGVGGQLPIEYIVAVPPRNRLRDAYTDPPGPLILIVVMIAFPLLIVVPPLTLTLLALHRARRDFRTGALATASVMFVRPKSTLGGMRNSDVQHEVVVSFQDVDGASREARAICTNAWLASALRPSDTVHIAYTGTNPKRVTLLDAFVR